jgi:hypothetical protein
MEYKPKSSETFISSKDYNVSRNFYADLSFEELKLSVNMSYFKFGEFGFYLQDAYVKDWIDNSMVFLEVRCQNHRYLFLHYDNYSFDTTQIIK